MAAEVTRAPDAREQKTASAPDAWKLTPEEIDAALRGGRRITPSKPDPWFGTPHPPSRWTRQQNLTIGMELSRAVKSNDRRSSAVIARLSKPEEVEAFEYRRLVGRTPDHRPIHEIHTCPLLARTRDGKRALIVAPGGDKLWVDASGTGHARGEDFPLATVVISSWVAAAIIVSVLAI